jgi:hypothetical protein
MFQYQFIGRPIAAALVSGEPAIGLKAYPHRRQPRSLVGNGSTEPRESRPGAGAPGARAMLARDR